MTEWLPDNSDWTHWLGPVVISIALVIVAVLSFVGAIGHREHCDYKYAPLCYRNGHAHCDTEGMK